MIQSFLHCRKALFLLCTYRNNIMPESAFHKEIKEQHFQLHKNMVSSQYDRYGSPKNFLKLLATRNLLLLQHGGRILPCFPSRGDTCIPGRYLGCPARNPSRHHTFIIEDYLNLSAYCEEPAVYDPEYILFSVGYSPGSVWQNRCLSQYT